MWTSLAILGAWLSWIVYEITGDVIIKLGDQYSKVSTSVQKTTSYIVDGVVYTYKEIKSIPEKYPNETEIAKQQLNNLKDKSINAAQFCFQYSKDQIAKYRTNAKEDDVPNENDKKESKEKNEVRKE